MTNHKLLEETVVEGAVIQAVTSKGGWNSYSSFTDWGGYDTLTVIKVYEVAPKPVMVPSDTPGVLF